MPFDTLLEAFEFVSFGPPEEHQAYVCLQTGKIYWHSELGDNEEELPEDVDNAERYVAVPHKNDLDLGKTLAIDFVEEFLPNDVNDVARIFSHRGAYSNFKNLLERRRLLPRWYETRPQRRKRHCASGVPIRVLRSVPLESDLTGWVPSGGRDTVIE